MTFRTPQEDIGNLTHNTRGYFSTQGLRARTNRELIRDRAQPTSTGREIVILGILVKNPTTHHCFPIRGRSDRAAAHGGGPALHPSFGKELLISPGTQSERDCRSE
jgi:hypothetical protein